MSDNNPDYRLQSRTPPRGSWDVDVNLTIEADAIIEEVRVNGMVPHWLDRILHRLSWHDTLHTPQWITRFPEIVRKYARYDDLDESERKLLEEELEDSIEKLRSQN